jgi:hypothetical protein
MIITTRELVGALACRTRETLLAKRALYAAAMIQVTAVIILLAGLAVLHHVYMA